MSVTVCIPVFNRRDLVGEAVRSALSQEIAELEVLVVDNFSTDGTWEYLQTVNDPRLRLARNDRNLGMFGNFNRCGALATGDYILYLCSDDQLCPGFLAHALEKLHANPRAAMISSHGRMRDEAGRGIGTAGKFLAPGLYDGASIVKAFFWIVAFCGTNLFNFPSGILFRRDAARAALPFRDDLGGPADIDYFFRSLAHGDLLIDDFVGCEIVVHTSQTARKNKDSGAMIVDLINLARLHLDTSEHQAFWRRIKRQLPASTLAWAARKARAGKIGEALGATRFGARWDEIIVAGAKRGALMGLARLGFLTCPYARRI